LRVLRNIFAISEPSTDKVKRCDQGTGECEHVCEDTPSGIKCSCFDGFRAKGPSCIGNPYAHSHIQICHCIFHIFISFESNAHTSLFYSFTRHAIFSSIFSTKFAYHLRIDYLHISCICCFRCFPSTCQFSICRTLYS